MLRFCLWILFALLLSSAQAEEPLISRQDKTVQIHAPFGLTITSSVILVQSSSNCNMTRSECLMEKTVFDDQDSLIITGKSVKLTGQITLENLEIKVSDLIKSRAFLEIDGHLTLEAKQVQVFNTTIVTGPVEIKGKSVTIDSNVFADSVDIVSPELDLQHALQAPVVTGKVSRLNLGKGSSIQQAITLLDDQDSHLFLTGGRYHGDANFGVKPISLHIGSSSLTHPVRVKIVGNVIFNRDNALHIGLTSKNSDHVDVIGTVDFGNVQLRTFKRRSHPSKRGFRFLRGMTKGEPRYVGSIKYRRIHDQALGKRDAFHDVILNIREAIVSTEELTGTIVSSSTLIPRALPTLIDSPSILERSPSLEKRSQATGIAIAALGNFVLSGKLSLNGEAISGSGVTRGIFFGTRPISAASAEIIGVANGTGDTIGILLTHHSQLSVTGDLQFIGDATGGYGIQLAQASTITSGTTVIRGTSHNRGDTWGVALLDGSSMTITSGEISGYGYNGAGGVNINSAHVTCNGPLVFNAVNQDADPSQRRQFGMFFHNGARFRAQQINATGVGTIGCSFESGSTLGTTNGGVNLTCRGSNGAGYYATSGAGVQATNGDLNLDSSTSTASGSHAIHVTSGGLLAAQGGRLILKGIASSQASDVYGCYIYSGSTVRYDQGLDLMAKGGSGAGHGVKIDGGSKLDGHGSINIQGSSFGSGAGVYIINGKINGVKTLFNLSGTLILETMAPVVDFVDVANVTIDKIINGNPLQQTMLRIFGKDGSTVDLGPVIDLQRINFGPEYWSRVTLTNVTNMQGIRFQTLDVHVNGNVSTVARPKTTNVNVYAWDGSWSRGVVRLAQNHSHIYFLGNTYPGRLDVVVGGKTLTLHANPNSISNVNFPDGMRLGSNSTLVSKMSGIGNCDQWIIPQNVTLGGVMKMESFNSYVFDDASLCQVVTMLDHIQNFTTLSAPRGHLEQKPTYIKYHGTPPR